MNIKQIEQYIRDNISENGHAVISPSWSKSWMSCEGTVYGMLEWRAVDPDNEQALEGTSGHFLLEASLTHMKRPDTITKNDMVFLKDDIKSNFKRSIDKRSNHLELQNIAHGYMMSTLNAEFDEEMIYHIGECYDKIQRYVERGYTLTPEGKVSLRRLLGHSQCDGISDVKLVKDDHLVIVDLKYGVVVPVVAEENYQLMIYGAPSITPSIKKVTIVVMQPRVTGHEWLEWQTSPDYILSFIQNQVKPKSLNALNVIVGDKEPTYNPSTSNCKYCPRRLRCKSRFDKFIKIVNRIIGSMKKQNLPSMSEEILSKILLDVPFVQSFIKDVEVESLKRIGQNKIIPNFKMVKGRPSRSWQSEKLMLAKAKSLGLTPDQIYNLKTKSVPQIEKTRSLTKDQKKTLMELSNTKYGKALLVPEHDSRKEFSKRSEAIKLFKKNT